MLCKLKVAQLMLLIYVLFHISCFLNCVIVDNVSDEPPPFMVRVLIYIVVISVSFRSMKTVLGMEP